MEARRTNAGSDVRRRKSDVRFRAASRTRPASRTQSGRLSLSRRRRSLLEIALGLIASAGFAGVIAHSRGRNRLPPLRLFQKMPNDKKTSGSNL